MPCKLSLNILQNIVNQQVTYTRYGCCRVSSEQHNSSTASASTASLSALPGNCDLKAERANGLYTVWAICFGTSP